MGHSSKPQKSTPGVWLVGLILWAATVYFIWSNQEQVGSIVKPLSLTAFDALMIVVLMAPFCMLWVILDALLFTPYLKLITARENLTVGAGSSAGDTIARANQLIDEYESRLTDARIIAVKEKTNALGAAKKDADAILEQASAEAQKILKDAREKIQSGQQALIDEALKDAAGLIDSLVQKVSAPRTPSSQTTHREV